MKYPLHVDGDQRRSTQKSSDFLDCAIPNYHLLVKACLPEYCAYQVDGGYANLVQVLTPMIVKQD